jgi:predicted DsbA family dithiol-disulfide isomerase
MSAKKIKVVVYSDYICPFCYIGFHRIEKLKEKFNLDVEWQPFELHPEIPKEGLFTDNMPLPRDYLEMALANVKRLADEDGLELKFSDKWPNSRLALFISEFARSKGKFDEFHVLVLDAFWKEGKDIGDLSLLLDLAGSIGLNKEKILEYLESDEPINKLREALTKLSGYGISGVPTFFIGDRIVVGAQPYEVFERVIKEAIAS